MPDKKPTITYYKLATYMRCPLQYFKKFVQNQTEPASGAMFQSRVYHDIIEKNYSQKVHSGKDLPIEYVMYLFNEEWDKQIKNEDIFFEMGEDPDRLKAQGAACLQVHHENIAPYVKPLMAEKSFVVSLGKSFPYDLSGRWDLITEDGMVVDNKMYRRVPRKDLLKKDLQLTVYALAYRIKYGECEKGLAIDAVLKWKVPKAVRVVTTRTNEQCRDALGVIGEVVGGIEAGRFDAVGSKSRYCDPSWCGFWYQCYRERETGGNFSCV